MALVFYARGDSSSANNSEVNSQNTSQVPTTQLTFEPAAGGDTILDFNSGLADPDTLLYIGGVPRTFTLEFSGTLPISNKMNPINGQDLRGQEIVVITDNLTGQRYYFLTDPALNTFATMDAFPNGAIPIDNINTTSSVYICFGRGTRLDTPAGRKRIENLRVGDLVRTENGPKPIRWIGSHRISGARLVADPAHWPVRIQAGALGHNCPARDVVLSPNHRVLVSGWKVELHFGVDEMLCPAKHLVNGTTVQQELPAEGVEYFHLLLDAHEIIRSENMLSESLYLGAETLQAVGPEAQDEIARLLAAEDLSAIPSQPTAAPVMRGYEAMLAA